MTHLGIERFNLLSPMWNGKVTLAFMLSTFLLWGYAGYGARREGMDFVSTCLVAVWSALISMTIAVTAGTLLEYYVAPIPLEEMRNWPEFLRSGSTDLRAFAIANTLEEASTHLAVGPMVAAIFGSVGFGLANLRGVRVASSRTSA